MIKKIILMFVFLVLLALPTTATVIDEFTGDTGGLTYGTSQQNVSGSWYATSTYTLVNITAKICITGTLGSEFLMKIYSADSSGKPTGAALGRSTNLIQETAVSSCATPSVFNWTFAGVPITINQMYAFSLSRLDNGDMNLGGGNEIQLFGGASAGYDYHQYGGGSWAARGSDNQMYFQTEAGAPAPTTLNVSDPTYPLANNQFAYNTISFNTTVNSTYRFNCSLVINNTIYQSKGMINGNSIYTEFNQTLADGLYSYYFNCYNSTGKSHVETNTTSSLIYIDSTPPNITNILMLNNTYVSGYLHINLSANDNINLYQIFINDSCIADNHTTGIGTPHYSNNNISVTSCALGNHNNNITVCDGHFQSLTCVTARSNYTVMGRYNITARYGVNGSLINTFNIYLNDSLIGSTNDAFLFVYNLSAQNYNFTFNGTNYATSTVVLNVNASFHNYQFIVYSAQSFNFTVLNEKTNTVINDTTITIEFISTSNVYNYTTTTGTLYVDLLTPDTYTIRYYGDLYGRKRHRFFTLTEQSHTDLSLYLINSSESTTVTLYDELTLDKLPNGIIYLQRYFQDLNEYRTVAEYQTDVSGQAFFDVEQQTEFYKWLVDFPYKTRKLETKSEYIESSTINLYISTTPNIADNFFKEENIQYSLTYSESNKEFSLTYTDSSNIADNYCFEIIEYGAYGKTVINDSCSTSSSSSLSLTGLTGNTTYYALFTADGEHIATGFIDIPKNSLNSGSFGVFLTLIIIVVFVFISQIHLLALLLGSSGLIFAKLLGIFPLAWGYIISVFVGSIILAIIIEMRK